MITGANGQIGTELMLELQRMYGENNVISTDIKPPKEEIGRFEILDILDHRRVSDFIMDNNVTQIYHLAALLSSKGEDNPQLTWKINFDAYLNILEIARFGEINRIFFPSTIGIYGPTTPKQETPQNSSFIPSTVYGISKISGELWNEYYRNKYGLDVRGLRYPGVISHKTRPAGGTTDFAVEIFFDAVEHNHYECFLSENTRLPMMYMPDVLKATLDLMHADRDSLSTSMAYNVSGFSLSPAELYSEIRKYLKDFTVEYKPDHRQKIADSWTESIDDSLARKDWNWNPSYSMESMVEDMLLNMAPAKMKGDSIIKS